MADTPHAPEDASFLAVRSFVVRAVLEHAEGVDEPRWRGQVTDVATGTRAGWIRPARLTRFVTARLAAERAEILGNGSEERLMAAPSMADVLADLLAPLTARLPTIAPPLLDANVTVERVRERLVGLGGLRGVETPSGLGQDVLAGGRLDARVRFQVWGQDAAAVDDAIVSVNGALLDDGDALREDGFLRLVGVETSLAEHVAVDDRWRKTTSYDVLYEFQYRGDDDATGLIARIPVTTDPEEVDSPAREVTTVTDELVRWDREGAAPLVVTGPTTIGAIAMVAFVPGAPPGGDVVLRRTRRDDTSPPDVVADLPAFVAATGGPDPSSTNVEVSLPVAALLAAATPTGDGIELGDWDADTVVDQHDPSRIELAPPLVLAMPDDRLEVAHSDPTGLGDDSILHLRFAAPLAVTT